MSKKKEKQKKRAEREKRSEINIQEVEGYVGNTKNIDELLEFLGEDNSKSADSGKKKKDKKDKKKTDNAAAVSSEKKKDRAGNDVSGENKKKDNTSSKKRESNSKKKDSKKRFAKPDMSDSAAGLESSNTSAIIQTSNSRLVSRIILNGGNITSASSESSEPTELKSLIESEDINNSKYSERSIDEAIAQSERQKAAMAAAASDVVIESPPESQVVPDDNLDMTAEAEVGSINQTIDVTYSIHLPDHYWVEEDFVRIKTPEPVEEDFKEVTHKKKRGHHVKHHNPSAGSSFADSPKNQSADQTKSHNAISSTESAEDSISHSSSDVAASEQLSTNNRNTSKRKPSPERRPSSSHSQINKAPPPVAKTMSTNNSVKDYSKAAAVNYKAPAYKGQPSTVAQGERPHYDMSELSFPTLAANTDNNKQTVIPQPKVATVKPICSWADMASKPQPSMQQTKSKSQHDTSGSKDMVSKPDIKPEVIEVGATALQNVTYAQIPTTETYANELLSVTVVPEQAVQLPQTYAVTDNPDKGAVLDDVETVESDNVAVDIPAASISQAISSPKQPNSPDLSSTGAVSTASKSANSHERPTERKKTNRKVEFVGKSAQKISTSTQKVQFGFGIGVSSSEGMNLMFGLDDEILEQTSLKTRTKKYSNTDDMSVGVKTDNLTKDTSSISMVQSNDNDHVPEPQVGHPDVIDPQSKLGAHGAAHSTGHEQTVCEKDTHKSVNILQNLLSVDISSERGDNSLSSLDNSSHPPYLLKIIKSLKKGTYYYSLPSFDGQFM